MGMVAKRGVRRTSNESCTALCPLGAACSHLNTAAVSHTSFQRAVGLVSQRPAMQEGYDRLVTPILMGQDSGEMGPIRPSTTD